MMESRFKFIYRLASRRVKDELELFDRSLDWISTGILLDVLMDDGKYETQLRVLKSATKHPFALLIQPINTY